MCWFVDKAIEGKEEEKKRFAKEKSIKTHEKRTPFKKESAKKK